MKTSVYIATSMDGYIARADGKLDWLSDKAYTIPGEDFGYSEFMANVDALIMGRVTFETVLGFNGPWPYGDKKIFVASNTLQSIPELLQDRVTIVSGDPEYIYRHVSEKGHQHVYVDGGRLIQSFIRADLIDDFIITRIPVLIGEGKPLFGSLDKDIPLKHYSTRSFRNGLVQSHYGVARIISMAEHI